jgi:hypothetical protein
MFISISKLNDLLIICDIVNDDLDNLKPKRPLEVFGLTVSDDVNYFNSGQGGKIRLPNVGAPVSVASTGSQSNEGDERLINADNGFVINVPCIQKIFKFYTRYLDIFRVDP